MSAPAAEDDEARRAREHPVPEDDLEEEQAQARQGAGRGRPMDWHRGARADHEEQSSVHSADPWARGDSWQSPGPSGGLEAEFAQFMDWRKRQMGNYEAMWNSSWSRAPWGWSESRWHGQDEHERTTAGPPPEWDGTNIEFKDWKLKAKIWLRTTRTPASARGPLLLKNLSKGPWQDLKHLASDEGWLQDPENGPKLVALMDSKEYYGEELRESLLAACSRLTYHLRREKGESARTFITKWETSERKLREHGVRLPEDYLGFLLVNALQLDSDRIKLFMNYSKGSLKVSDVKEWLRIHETELDMSVLGNDKRKAKVTYHLDDETTEINEVQHLKHDDTEPEEEESVEMLLTALQDFDDTGGNSVELTEPEAQELLLTMAKGHRAKQNTFAGAAKAKKNRDLARGYGAGRQGAFRPGTYPVSIDEIKRRTRCFKCGQLGHYSKECTNKSHDSKDAKPKEINLIENIGEWDLLDILKDNDSFQAMHLMGDKNNSFYPGQESSHSSTSEWQHVVAIDHGNFDQDEAEFAYMCPVVPRTISHECMFLCPADVNGQCATIDTGCQRMAVGLATLRELEATQPKALPIQYRSEIHQFKSVHMTSSTRRVAIVPSSLGPRGCHLKPAIFEDEHSQHAPFLISLPFLLHCKAVLHLDVDRGLRLHLGKMNHDVQCYLGPTGALRVCLQDFTSDMIEALSTKSLGGDAEYEVFRTETTNGQSVELKPPSASCLGDSHGAEYPGQAGQAYYREPVAPPPGLAPLRPQVHGGGQLRALSQGHEGPQGARARRDAEPLHPGHRGGHGREEPHAPPGLLAANQRRPEPEAGGHGRLLGRVDHVEPVGKLGEESLLSEGRSSSQSGYDVGDSTYDGRSQPRVASLPVRPHDKDLRDDEGGRELRKDVLALRRDNLGPEVRVLPVVTRTPSVPAQQGTPQRDEEGGRCGGTTGISSTSTGSMSTPTDYNQRQQPLREQADMQGLWSTSEVRDHRCGGRDLREVQGAEQEAAQGTTAIYELDLRKDDSTELYSEPTGVAGLPGVPDVAPDAGEHQEAQRAYQEDALRGSMSGRSCTIGLRRQVFGALKKAEVLWTDLYQLLCDDREPEAHIIDTCKVIREACSRQMPHLKHMTELYSLEIPQLRKIAEICNPGRFRKFADAYGLRSSAVFDIELGWDLLCPKAQRHVVQYVQSEKPGLILLAPPCTKFSSLQALSFSRTYASEQHFNKHVIELRKARQLLKLCATICQLCHQQGSTYVFEHPWAASSWNEPCLRALLRRGDSYLARTDQCMFGLRSPSGEAMRKRSGFLTNSLDLAEYLNKTCPGTHKHELVIGSDPYSGKSRSVLAQRYPDQLVRGVLRVYSARHVASQELHFIDATDVIADDDRLEEHLAESGYIPRELEHHEEIYHVDDHQDEDAITTEDGRPAATFPGTHPLSLEALVKRAHEGLGHPSRERFIRILNYSKASKQIIDIARRLRCSVCERFKTPRPSRAAAPPKEVGLNDTVGCDTIQIRTPFSEKTKFSTSSTIQVTSNSWYLYAATRRRRLDMGIDNG